MTYCDELENNLTMEQCMEYYDYCSNVDELCGNKNETSTFILIIIVFMIFTFFVGVFTYYHKKRLGL